MTPMGNVLDVLDVLDVQEFPVLTIMLRQGIEFPLTWWPRWPDPPMGNEYTQWPTLPHHHPQCPTLDTPQWFHLMITHLWEISQPPLPHMGAQCFMWNISHNPQYTQPCPQSQQGVTRGLPLRHKTQSTQEKGVHKGPCPWANPAKKKDNKLFFLLHNHLSHKGGFKGGGSSPLKEMETKSISLCLLASPCISLPPFAFVLSVSDCLFVVFAQPTQPPTYTIQPTHNTTHTTNTQPPTYTIQPIHNTTSKGQSTPPKFSSIPFHSFWFHELMQSQSDRFIGEQPEHTQN